MRFSIPAAFIGAVAICGVVLAGGSSPHDVREIRLVARDMTYFDAATREANPTLRLKRGERIRLVLTNDDQPGVIGEVGTILGRHGVNIASFALGRGVAGAIGVVNVDEDEHAAHVLDAAVEEIRRVPAIREACIIRLS